MLEPYDLIKSIVITEKSMYMQKNLNKYIFEINKISNKINISKAIESIYDVKVQNVNIFNRIGKLKRRGNKSYKYGFTPSRKYAIVTLSEGKINLDI